MAGFVRVNAQAAWQAARWTWRFYQRHWPVIVGISLIPATERLVSQLWGEDRPAVLMETITGVARLVLVAVILVLLNRETRASRPHGAERRGHPMAYLRTRWLDLVFQLLEIGVLAVVFDVIPEQVIAPLVPERYQHLYIGLLLAVKNPTVIAFTMVWVIGTVWRVVTWNPEASPSRLSTTTPPGR